MPCPPKLSGFSVQGGSGLSQDGWARQPDGESNPRSYCQIQIEGRGKGGPFAAIKAYYALLGWVNIGYFGRPH